MKIAETKLPGVLFLQPDVFRDGRGALTKPFHKDTFLELGLTTNFAESFYSISNKGVVRGMHFQIPPQDHTKVVYVPHGAILDVILDIRKGSPTYGQYAALELSDANCAMVYIPVGCAHGFLSLRDDSCTTYLQSTIRSAEHESGIKYDSFGMKWGVKDIIVSERDQAFPGLESYDTPFTWSKKDTR